LSPSTFTNRRPLLVKVCGLNLYQPTAQVAPRILRRREAQVLARIEASSYRASQDARHAL
jgi:hypothetical protein